MALPHLLSSWDKMTAQTVLLKDTRGTEAFHEMEAKLKTLQSKFEWNYFGLNCFCSCTKCPPEAFTWKGSLVDVGSLWYYHENMNYNYSSSSFGIQLSCSINNNDHNGNNDNKLELCFVIERSTQHNDQQYVTYITKKLHMLLKHAPEKLILDLISIRFQHIRSITTAHYILLLCYHY